MPDGEGEGLGDGEGYDGPLGEGDGDGLGLADGNKVLGWDCGLAAQERAMGNARLMGMAKPMFPDEDVTPAVSIPMTAPVAARTKGPPLFPGAMGAEI